MMDCKVLHVLIVALVAQVITARVMCPSHPNCVCGGTFAVELNCNIDGRTVKIDLLPSTYMNIKCENASSLDYSKLPKCANGMKPFKSVSFKDCPLPTTSFKHILDQVGVSKTMSLIFQNSKPLSGYFNRNHFSGLNDLTKLLLSLNGNTHLPDNLFMDVHNITWLNIRCNNINLSEELFKPLERLETLEISHNHMTNMSSNLLSHLSLLRKLSLWQSNVTWFSKDFFTGVDVLEELDLSSNGLNELPTSIFKPLRKLKKLTLFSNKFSTLPKDLFSNNNKLETIVILNNDVKIKSLPRALFGNLSNLRQVYIQRSGIESVPYDVFINSSFITNISLAYNDIAEIPESTFNDQINLLELDLSHNELKSIEMKLFSSLVELEKLDLSYNFIEELSRDTFTPLLSLNYLNMEHNNLKRVSAFLFNINKQRMWISLAYNNLDFETLTLYSNSVWLISNVSPFANTFNLKMLNLSHNKFKHTFQDWFSNGHENLDISYNSIQYLWEDSIATFNINQQLKFEYSQKLVAKFKHVSLSNNPLSCDCLNFKFVKFLKFNLKWKGIDDPFNHCPTVNIYICTTEFELLLQLSIFLLIGCLFFLYSKRKTIMLMMKHKIQDFRSYDKNKCKNIYILFCDEDKEFVFNEVFPQLKDNNKFKVHLKSMKVNEEHNSLKDITSALHDNDFTLIIFSPNYLMATYRDVNIKEIRREMLQNKNTIYVYTDIGPENSIYAFLKEQRDKRTAILWDNPNFWNDLNFVLLNGFKKKVRFSSVNDIPMKVTTSSNMESIVTSTTDNLPEGPDILIEKNMRSQE